jgi:hypothetical protein
VSQVVARSRHRLDILSVSRAASQGRQGVVCQNGEERGPEASGWEDLSTLFRIGALQDTGFPRLFEFATSIYLHKENSQSLGLKNPPIDVFLPSQ